MFGGCGNVYGTKLAETSQAYLAYRKSLVPNTGAIQVHARP